MTSRTKNRLPTAAPSRPRGFALLLILCFSLSAQLLPQTLANPHCSLATCTHALSIFPFTLSNNRRTWPKVSRSSLLSFDDSFLSCQQQSWIDNFINQCVLRCRPSLKSEKVAIVVRRIAIASADGKKLYRKSFDWKKRLSAKSNDDEEKEKQSIEFILLSGRNNDWIGSTSNAHRQTDTHTHTYERRTSLEP